MATKATAPPASAEIEIYEITTQEVEVHILGTTPLILNRMSQKAWFELLAPRGRKTTIEKASTMKHNPIKEFRDSPYMLPKHLKAPTALGVMASGFKKALQTAALRTPGVRKAEIGQLVRVPGEYIPVFGLPLVFMAITKSADINHTPDVRTRSILAEWACRININFVTPALRQKSIANLLAAAGFISGIGDWRQEKGSGDYGSFRICSPDDPDYQRITKTMGRQAQLEALANPRAYNDETSEMLAWFEVETKRRGFPAANEPVAEGKPIAPFMGRVLNGGDEEFAAPAPKRRGRPPGSGRAASNGNATP